MENLKLVVRGQTVKPCAADGMSASELLQPPSWALTDMVKLPCLSIRQPWAHLILHAGKDIENRSWKTKFRGEFLIHAAKGMTREEWDDAIDFTRGIELKIDPNAPPAVTIKTIQRGGIVGVARLVDCVSSHSSPWLIGDWGFVLKDVRPLEFLPCKGSLGFFHLPYAEHTHAEGVE